MIRDILPPTQYSAHVRVCTCGFLVSGFPTPPRPGMKKILLPLAQSSQVHTSLGIHLQNNQFSIHPSTQVLPLPNTQEKRIISLQDPVSNSKSLQIHKFLFPKMEESKHYTKQTLGSLFSRLGYNTDHDLSLQICSNKDPLVSHRNMET